MIAWPVKAFDSVVTWQEAIRFHWKLLIIHLHGKRCTEIDNISITHVWKLGIRKSIGILFPKMFKPRFPKKINKLTKPRCGRRAVIIVFEMVDMKKFDVLHAVVILKIVGHCSGQSVL
jgi:hypothetical protein